jgi:hypothetical protein
MLPNQNNLASAKAAGGRGGPLAVVAAGELKCRYVILVPIRSADRSMMQLVYGQLFHKAVELQIRSVAVPALGTGSFGLSFRQASIDMRDAISCIPDFGTLQQIQLVDLSGKAMKEFELSLQELVAPQTQGRRKAANGKWMNFTCRKHTLCRSPFKLLPLPPSKDQAGRRSGRGSMRSPHPTTTWRCRQLRLPRCERTGTLPMGTTMNSWHVRFVSAT